MPWMQMDIHLYFKTMLHAKTNGVHFMEISNAFFITCPWQETTHYIGISHHKKKQIRMSFNIITRSFIRWLMHSWGFGQYYTLCMCMISWFRPKMCYCNHILMQNQLCYWIFLTFQQGKMIWCHVHDQHLPNQFQAHKQYIFQYICLQHTFL